jgi:pyruvate dehydrogenase E1 component alpha subunit
MYWGGDERGNDYGGNAANDFPFCVPISTQCLHAAGAALSFKLQGQSQVAVAVCGDGGSSKTDFYAALNSAGAYSLPLILCVVNNGWAISVPRSAQTGAQTLAQKGIAGGLHCLQVDGNDLIAVLEAMRQARERALAGDGATVIEFLTYRLSDHTTADDARRYRDDAQVKAAWVREPMIRLRNYLVAQGVWDDAQEATWKAECSAHVDIEVDAYLATPVQPIESMFDYLYADPPPELLSQRATAIALEQRA